MSSISCSICQDNIIDNSTVFCCNQTYHFKCISTWICSKIAPNCPICRKELGLNVVKLIKDIKHIKKMQKSIAKQIIDKNNELLSITNYVKIPERRPSLPYRRVAYDPPRYGPRRRNALTAQIIGLQRRNAISTTQVIGGLRPISIPLRRNAVANIPRF
jgi:hypothetical protein